MLTNHLRPPRCQRVLSAWRCDLPASSPCPTCDLLDFGIPFTSSLQTILHLGPTSFIVWDISTRTVSSRRKAACAHILWLSASSRTSPHGRCQLVFSALVRRSYSFSGTRFDDLRSNSSFVSLFFVLNKADTFHSHIPLQWLPRAWWVAVNIAMSGSMLVKVKRKPFLLQLSNRFLCFFKIWTILNSLQANIRWWDEEK